MGDQMKADRPERCSTLFSAWTPPSHWPVTARTLTCSSPAPTSGPSGTSGLSQRCQADRWRWPEPTRSSGGDRGGRPAVQTSLESTGQTVVLPTRVQAEWPLPHSGGDLPLTLEDLNIFLQPQSLERNILAFIQDSDPQRYLLRSGRFDSKNETRPCQLNMFFAVKVT